MTNVFAPLEILVEVKVGIIEIKIMVQMLEKLFYQQIRDC